MFIFIPQYVFTFFRFAEFIETSAHVNTETVEEYEKEFCDSDDDDVYDESESSDFIDGIQEIDYTSDSE